VTVRQAVDAPGAAAYDRRMALKLSALWHREHPMPRNASVGERIGWHVEHQQACACRPIPAKLAALMRAALGEATPKAKARGAVRAKRRTGIG
jgi:hypothetical protein